MDDDIEQMLEEIAAKGPRKEVARELLGSTNYLLFVDADGSGKFRTHFEHDLSMVSTSVLVHMLQMMQEELYKTLKMIALGEGGDDDGE